MPIGSVIDLDSSADGNNHDSPSDCLNADHSHCDRNAHARP